ncbi:MAG: restriction endonuclease subunit S [Rhodospirillales bacterium]|nr:restriction endonuclease subunit S [Rhodospirillales bacterium]
MRISLRASDRGVRRGPGDILIERSNTPELVGTTALHRGPHHGAIFPDLLIRVRVSPLLLPEFLEAVLKAQPTRRYFQRSAQGIAGSMPKIDQTDVANLEVPLPPLDEQRRIVAEIDGQLSVVDAMAAEIDRALKRSAALRRSILERAFSSILERAFSGELVPQDPSDEPASVLLERLAAARAKAPKPGRRRRPVASGRASTVDA